MFISCAILSSADRFFALSLYALQEILYKHSCCFHSSISFSSTSSVQLSIFKQWCLNVATMQYKLTNTGNEKPETSGDVIIYVITSCPTNWLNWVTTLRNDYWSLVHCVCLYDVRDVELRQRRYEHSHDATQLDVELSWVELSRYKPGLMHELQE